MLEGPAMRQFGGGGDVFGDAGEFRVVGEDRAAAAGGDGLVAVETKGSKAAESARMAAVVVTAQGFRRILHQGQVEVVGHGE
jgi:hypothetical protein